MVDHHCENACRNYEVITEISSQKIQKYHSSYAQFCFGNEKENLFTYDIKICKTTILPAV